MPVREGYIVLQIKFGMFSKAGANANVLHVTGGLSFHARGWIYELWCEMTLEINPDKTTQAQAALKLELII